MTVWAPTMIARWVRDAGLPEGQVIHATALALAATHGADHYKANPTAHPVTERQGIFALRRADLPPDLDVDLFSPTDSATALVGIWRAQGERWDWHPVHLSGAALALEPMVTLMLADRNSPRGAVDVRSFRESVSRMVQLRDAMVQAGSLDGP